MLLNNYLIKLSLNRGNNLKKKFLDEIQNFELVFVWFVKSTIYTIIVLRKIHINIK